MVHTWFVAKLKKSSNQTLSIQKKSRLRFLSVISVFFIPFFSHYDYLFLSHSMCGYCVEVVVVVVIDAVHARKDSKSSK
jgi:hypothetical protein